MGAPWIGEGSGDRQGPQRVQGSARWGALGGEDITNASADVFPLIERIVSSLLPLSSPPRARRERPRLNPRLLYTGLFSPHVIFICIPYLNLQKKIT